MTPKELITQMDEEWMWEACESLFDDEEMNGIRYKWEDPDGGDIKYRCELVLRRVVEEEKHCG